MARSTIFVVVADSQFSRRGGKDGLSFREAQVLEMVARGLSNADVARELGVTVHAVKFHLASIFRKLKVANRTEAAVAYLRRA